MSEQIKAVGNDRMASIISVINSQIDRAMNARADDMLMAWNGNMEEATANEKNLPPLKLGISVTVDLEKGSVDTSLRFSVIYQEVISEKLPDPNQPEIPGILV